MHVTDVTPYNECYTHAFNPNGVPTMRTTKRDALPCGLPANLSPEWSSNHACYKASSSTKWVTSMLVPSVQLHACARTHAPARMHSHACTCTHALASMH
eukprot:86254-Pleurochrysis_carterae.AAC.2